MLHFLFRRLTGQPKRGQTLFDAAVAEARQRHWYSDAGVPDTLEGRFAMLATVCALMLVRLEPAGDEGQTQSVWLTERFVEAMDAEHRQMGINDPGLGKKVRKLVASLAWRVEEWRGATSGARAWGESVRRSIYGAMPPGEREAAEASDRLAGLWERLAAAPDQRLIEGEF